MLGAFDKSFSFPLLSFSPIGNPLIKSNNCLFGKPKDADKDFKFNRSSGWGYKAL